jgi:hypothetical protein
VSTGIETTWNTAGNISIVSKYCGAKATKIIPLSQLDPDTTEKKCILRNDVAQKTDCLEKQKLGP